MSFGIKGITLTGDGSGTGAFEAHPSTDAQDVPSAREAHPSPFGVYAVEAGLGTGRFGPVFRAVDAVGAPVVIRTFDYPFSPEQLQQFRAALEALCAAPLEHPSIARPLAHGIGTDGRPYIVHDYLPGVPLSEFTPAEGRRGIEDIVNRLTYLAGALDFASAAGIRHGALGPGDVIVSSENAGVTGIGLVQAFQTAGIPGFHAGSTADIAALVMIARQLLADRVTPAGASVLNSPLPVSALEFAAALRQTLTDEVVPAPVAFVAAEVAPHPAAIDSDAPFREVGEPAEAPIGIEGEPVDAHLQHDLVDIQLRRDEEKLPLPVPPVTPAVVPYPGPRSRGWMLAAALALAFGVVAGFAGGFFVARENPTAIPAPVVRTDGPGVEATDGRAPTEVVTEPVIPTPAPPPASSNPAGSQPDASQVPLQSGATPPASTPAATADPNRPGPAAPEQAPPAARRTPPQPSAAGPAAIRVESNPAGAQVFVDGRSVGYAPLVVGQLAPGTHSIRMEMPGHRPWVSAVTLAPGARERVAASLEQ